MSSLLCVQFEHFMQIMVLQCILQVLAEQHTCNHQTQTQSQVFTLTMCIVRSGAATLALLGVGA